MQNYFVKSGLNAREIQIKLRSFKTLTKIAIKWIKIQARCQIVNEKVNDDNDEVSALLELDMLLVQSRLYN